MYLFPGLLNFMHRLQQLHRPHWLNPTGPVGPTGPTAIGDQPPALILVP